MTEQHLQAIRMNKAIGNYNRVYCQICGKEIEIFNNELSRQNYLENGNACVDC